MTDDDLRAEVRRLREEVDALQRRLDAVESAVDGDPDAATDPPASADEPPGGRQGFVRWGRIAAGAGLAVAYFSVYAAYGFETYRDAIGTPLWAVLAALSLLVAVTAALSVRDGAPLVAGEAFLLGYVTALLSTEAATVVVTPVYALLLAAAVVAIATVKPWRGLATASAFATYAVVSLWVVVVDPARAGVAAVAAAAFATYLGGSYALHAAGEYDRWRRVFLPTLTATNALFGGVLLEGSL